MAIHDISIDLGTSNVVISIAGQGIVLNEPSVVAIDKTSGNILAVGSKASEMIGKTHRNIIPIRPLQNGVISDYTATEKMLNYFLNKILDKKGINKFIMPRVMICIPTGTTEVEKLAVEDAVKNAGAREVYTIEDPIAAAIGSGIDIASPYGNMIIDIGGGTTDIAVISLGGSVVSECLNIGGDKFDDAIITHIKKTHNFLIGEKTAEKIKLNIGTAYVEEEKSMVVVGRNLVTGLPAKLELTSSEIKASLDAYIQQVVSATCSVLEKTPPELASDIYESGIVITGGGALLSGLDKRIEEKTNIQVRIAEDPLLCVAKGIEKSLSSLNLLDKSKK